MSNRMNINRVHLPSDNQTLDPEFESYVKKLDIKERFFEKNGVITSVEAEEEE